MSDAASKPEPPVGATLQIRKAILAWGVPTTIKADRGSDFTAEATKRLFATLGSDPEAPGCRFSQAGDLE